MAHTPGPWFIKKAAYPSDGEFDYSVSTETGGKPYVILEAFGRVSEEIKPDAEANAKLCAAAPDMYAALEELKDYLNDRADCDSDQDGYIPNKEMKLLAEVRAALAKAGARS
jgi:hypothetical protein